MQGPIFRRGRNFVANQVLEHQGYCSAFVRIPSWFGCQFRPAFEFCIWNSVASPCRLHLHEMVSPTPRVLQNMQRWSIFGLHSFFLLYDFQCWFSIVAQCSESSQQLWCGWLIRRCGISKRLPLPKSRRTLRHGKGTQDRLQSLFHSEPPTFSFNRNDPTMSVLLLVINQSIYLSMLAIYLYVIYFSFCICLYSIHIFIYLAI